MGNRRHQDGARRGRRMLPVLLLLASLPALVPAAALVYKWTGARGTVHYGRALLRARDVSRQTAIGHALPGFQF